MVFTLSRIWGGIGKPRPYQDFSASPGLEETASCLATESLQHREKLFDVHHLPDEFFVGFLIPILIEQNQPFFSVFLVEFHESTECAGADIVIQTDLLDCLLPDQPSRDHMEDEEYTVNAVRDQDRCKDCMRSITCVALHALHLTRLIFTSFL